MKKFSHSLRKYLRREKARIRRTKKNALEVAGEIENLYDKVGKRR